MFAWVLHRVTGFALVLFLMLHIWEMHELGKGKESFEAVIQRFSSLPFKVGEALLFGAILYHAFNGVRVILVDFWGGSRYHRAAFAVTMVLTVALFLFGASAILF
jgi:succinate dehydrogenase / fumarate reductase cytochrome b subunit